MTKLIIEEYKPLTYDDIEIASYEEAVANAKPFTAETFKEAFEIMKERMNRPPELTKFPVGCYTGKQLNDLFDIKGYENGVIYILYQEVWV